MEVALLIAEKCSDDADGTNKLLSKALDTANERNLNAYEEACAKYLDKKLIRNVSKRIIM